MELDNLKNIDLRLLAVFTEMMRTGSVSEAAENLGVSQPAISMSLSRMRKQLGDPLFVRTSRGMEPTPLALALQDPLTRAFQLVSDATRARAGFDPLSSTRLFRIAMADAGYLGVFPPLLARQKALAPHIRFEFTSITEKTAKLMESGHIDLTIAFLPQLGAGIYQQQLLLQEFVAAVRLDHPRIQSALTRDDYAREQHLAIAPSGTGHGILDRYIEDAGIHRKIGWQVQNLLGVPALIGDSDYIVTLPQAPAAFFARQGLVRVFPLPFPSPSIVVMQYWHERFHRDEGLRWLRRQLVSLWPAPDPPQ